MKYAIVLFTLGLLFSCGEEETPKKEVELMQTREELIEIKDGIYTEYYQGRKKVKFRGPQDEGGLRHGIWNFYDENGVNISMTEYRHGLKNGVSLVKYSNGGTQYTGEYENDIQVGVWKTYDVKGKLIDTRDYTEMNKEQLDRAKSASKTEVTK